MGAKVQKSHRKNQNISIFYDSLYLSVVFCEITLDLSLLLNDTSGADTSVYAQHKQKLPKIFIQLIIQ